MFTQLMEKLGERTKAANPPRDGDYIGEDGLLYCGNCHTPKQCNCGNFGILFCACKCESEKYAAERAAEKKAAEEFGQSIESARKRQKCFDDDFYKHMSFENDRNASPKAVQAARYYVDNFERFKSENKGLMFLGNCGTGKTFAACCIANALTDKQYNVWVITANELIRKVGNFNTSEAALSRIGYDDLLVIDDFGTQSNSEYNTQTLFDIIDKRYKSAKPLVITSNLDPGEFRKDRNDIQQKRIFDRIIEMCMCPISPVVLSGESLRGKIAREKHFQDHEEG